MTKKKMLVIIGTVVAIFLIVLIIFLNKSNKEEVITYNINFDTSGGNKIESQLVNEGEKIIKPNDPTKEGYIFVEWTYQNKTYDFSLSVDKDMTLIARWLEKNEDKEMFTIKFDSDGGTTIPNQIIEMNGKVIKPSDPTKEGYIFKYWTLNDEEYDFNKEVSVELELKAVWEEEVKEKNNTSNKPNSTTNNDKKEETKEEQKPEVKKYTVIFNSTGGSTVSNQTINEGGKVSQPANPTKNGYTFTGWTLNGNTYDFNASVTGDITLIANWKENVKNNYTVSFDSNGGSSVSAQTVVEGNKVIQPTTPTKEGYTFTGWTLNGSTYDFNTTVTSNITLVASWVQKSYTVSIRGADQFSTDSILTVYENGATISVKAIKYTDGTVLCYGTNPTVATIDTIGETSFIVVLNGGTEVIATVQ